MRRLLICLASLIWWSAPASACEINDVTWSGSVIEYDPFVTSPQTKNYTLKIDTDGNCGELKAQALMPTNATPQGAPRIEITSSSPARTVYYHNRAGASEHFAIRNFTAESASVSLSYDVSVIDEFLPPTKSHLEIPVRFLISDVNGASNKDVTDSVSVQVKERLQANFTGAAAEDLKHELVLGSLSANGTAQGKVQIAVAGNVGYSMSFTSEKGGQLALGGNWSIPYELKLGGTKITGLTPKAPVSMLPFKSPSSRDPIDHMLELSISGVIVGNLRAGTYADEITITIKALE